MTNPVSNAQPTPEAQLGSSSRCERLIDCARIERILRAATRSIPQRRMELFSHPGSTGSPRVFFMPDSPEPGKKDIIKRALSRRKSVVAIKKSEINSPEEEIRNLRRVAEAGVPHCIKLRDIVYYPEQESPSIETEYAGHNLFEAAKWVFFNVNKIKLFSAQALEAFDKMHKNHFIHGDVKPENFAIGSFTYLRDIVSEDRRSEVGNKIVIGPQVTVLDVDQLTDDRKEKCPERSGTLTYATLKRLMRIPVGKSEGGEEANGEGDLFSLGLTIYRAYTNQNIASFSHKLREFLSGKPDALDDFSKLTNYNSIRSNISKFTADLNKMGFVGVDADDAIIMLVCLHEFENAFGEIPTKVIDEVCNPSGIEDDKFAEDRNLLSSFLFKSDKDENGNKVYSLRDLGFFFPVSLSWKDRIRQIGQKFGDNDCEGLIDFIGKLCSNNPPTAEALLKDEFLEGGFHFNLEFSDEFVKKFFKTSCRLLIIDSEDPENTSIVDLNRSPESIEADCRHLLKNNSGKFLVKVIENRSRRLFKKDNFEKEVIIADGQTLKIDL